MTANICLLLAGCGKMGGALLGGWIQQGISASDVYIVEPDPDTASHLSQTYDVSVFSDAADLPTNLSPNVVLVAVKPQMMDAVAPAYRRFAGSNTTFLSIAAGKNIAYFEEHFGDTAAIVRSMPNTPAAVARGITVCCSNTYASQIQKDLCTNLLQAVGSVEWVEDEGMLDAVTAVSGGGPAYVFLLSESLARAGITAGLPENLSWRLARETVAGSGELLYQSPEDAATLRQNVTSPGGTTAEALKVLMGNDDSGDGWQPILNAAIQAATDRSRELAD